MVIFKSTPTQKNNVVCPVPFQELVPLLLHNKERILSDPQLKTARLSWEYFVSISLIGYSEIPVGSLIELWYDPNLRWVKKCPECGGTVYFQGFGGSINSNRGSGWGHCVNCNSFTRIRFDGFSAFTGLKLSRKYRDEYNSPQIEISELIDILKQETSNTRSTEYGI